MRVLVTGAAGRIGAHLTRELIQMGHAVRAFALPDDPRVAAISGLGVEVVYGRVEDAEVVAQATRGVDAVYHLAGALTSRGNSEQEFFEYNLRGTFNMLMAVRANAPDLQRFVYASSDAVYWKGSGEACYLPVDEAHPRLAGSVYGASKIGAEELCLTFWRGFGVPITILRFGATAEPAELIDPRSVFARWHFVRAARLALAALPAPTAEDTEAGAILQGLDDGPDRLVILADRDGRAEIRQWSDARDVAAGCASVLAVPGAVGEAFNLGGVAPHTADEFIPYIASKTGYPYVTARLPTARAAWYISSAKARGMLGYRPRHSVFDMVDQAVAALPSLFNPG